MKRRKVLLLVASVTSALSGCLTQKGSKSRLDNDIEARRVVDIKIYTEDDDLTFDKTYNLATDESIEEAGVTGAGSFTLEVGSEDLNEEYDFVANCKPTVLTVQIKSDNITYVQSACS